MGILYTGTDPAHCGQEVIHCPLIKIVPREMDRQLEAILADLPHFTHFVFTSKNAARLFAKYVPEEASVVAVGKVTAKALEKVGMRVSVVAEDERQEGVMEKLDLMDLEDAYVCVPCSGLARPALGEYLIDRCIRHQICPIYETRVQRPKKMPNMDTIDEIVFTSPSTVKAFLEIFSTFPQNVKLTPIGPVTEQALNGALYGNEIHPT